MGDAVAGFSKFLKKLYPVILYHVGLYRIWDEDKLRDAPDARGKLWAWALAAATASCIHSNMNCLNLCCNDVLAGGRCCSGQRPLWQPPFCRSQRCFSTWGGGPVKARPADAVGFREPAAAPHALWRLPERCVKTIDHCRYHPLTSSSWSSIALVSKTYFVLSCVASASFHLECPAGGRFGWLLCLSAYLGVIAWSRVSAILVPV
jgi:hypothetical protein